MSVMQKLSAMLSIYWLVFWFKVLTMFRVKNMEGWLYERSFLTNGIVSYLIPALIIWGTLT